VILTVNAGSSSIRLALFEGPRRLRDHHADAGPAPAAVLDDFLADIRPEVVAHRVVHGGPAGHSTRILDDATAAEIARAAPLAPLHNPPTLTWFQACRAAVAGAVHLAIFDGAFFAHLPAAAATYALPADLRARLGLRRMGFHGIAHRSMWETWNASGAPDAARVISFQLGSGCSVAALRDGAPIDTSMGFTPLEGLVMATRPGDLDPGVILHLLGEGRMSVEEIGEMLNGRSGLAGLAGGHGDLRALLADGGAEATLAIEVYCYRARKYLGAYFAALGGCDAVLIGGGAGEHAPSIRARILGGLEALGIVLDEAANASAKAPARISAAESRVALWVVGTDEESVLAREAADWAASHGRG
jgi:acetate kinase